jgi:hypothetical protein
MVDILEALIRDPATNPTAKCTAIRTLRELQAENPGESQAGFEELDKAKPRHLHHVEGQKGA